MTAAASARRIVLIGATGTFGSRLARMLARLPGVELVLAARGAPALERLRADLARANGPALLATAPLDRGDLRAMTALQPWLTIDASGPFQDSGYDRPLALVAAGSHWIDLADARAYVAGFAAALGPAAAASGAVAVTGASSTPTLSNAAADRLTAGWLRVDAVRAAILPGARAPRGPAVMAAILSWIGQPVRVFRAGAWRTAPGWSLTHRIDVPGLGRRWVSLCETPDLDVLPARFAVRQDALMLAGLQPAPAHLGMVLLSAAARSGRLPGRPVLGAVLSTVAGLVAPFGDDRGGMVVEAEGADPENRPIVARWTLVAEDEAGPSVPAAPAAAVARALLHGRGPAAGACVAAGWPALQAVLAELDGLPIASWTDESRPASPTLFRRILGRCFDELPRPIRRVHGSGSATFRGHAVVRTGRGPGPALVRAVLGLPRSGRWEAEVAIEAGPTGERWSRRFGTSRFSSRLASGGPGILEERFGPLRFRFRVRRDGRGLAWDPIGWSLLRLGLPRRLALRIRARIGAEDGAYRFRILVAHPWTGLLFAYRGALVSW